MEIHRAAPCAGLGSSDSTEDLMRAKRLMLSGILFIIAGVAMVSSGLVGKRSPNLAIGGAFMAIGGAFIAISRRSAAD
jgi:hypothetical protein